MTGLFRARVEYNKDDQQLCRVKVRVPTLHGLPGEDKSLHYKDLPWAYPCTPYPAGYDHGSVVIPEVGSYVWVLFEAGNPNQPVYIGSMYAKNSSTYQPMGTIDDLDSLNKRYVASEGRWNRPGYQNEVPSEMFNSDYDPEVSKSILYKSPKGATIEIDETDEQESMSFIDRLGQIIKFISPVDKESNSYNSHRRFDKRCDKDTQYDTEEISFHKKALIFVKDARGQFLRFLAKKGKSKIEIVSKDKKNTSVLGLYSGAGSSLLESVYGDNRVRLVLDAKNLCAKIVITKGDKVLSELTLDENISQWSQGEVLTKFKQQPKQSTDKWKDAQDELYKEGDE